MTIVLDPPASSTYRSTAPFRAPRPSSGAAHRRPWEIAMNAVVTLLADPTARLSSPRAAAVIREQIHRVEGTVDVLDAHAALTDTWKALLTLAEATEDSGEPLVATQHLVVVLAEMLCSPLRMPQRHRQCYWELLQDCMRILSRTPDHEKTLQRIDHRFPRWMDLLHTVVWCGTIRPVSGLSRISSRNQRCGAAAGYDDGRHHAASGPRFPVAHEAQYLGNFSDHWSMHTSNR